MTQTIKEQFIERILVCEDSDEVSHAISSLGNCWAAGYLDAKSYDIYEITDDIEEVREYLEDHAKGIRIEYFYQN